MALAIAGEDWTGAGRILVRVDPRMQAAAARQLDVTVLTFRHGLAGDVNFVGEGLVMALMVREDGGRAVVLNPYRPFARSVGAGEFELTHQVRRDSLQLNDAEFAQIVALARGSSENGELGEAQRQGIWSLDSYVQLHDEVLRRYDHHCAVTGKAFTPGGRPHPDLRIVPLRPREMGGSLDASNFLPMIAEAETAWRQGDFSIGARHEFITVLGKIDEGLLVLLQRAGKLRLPEDELLWPDARELEFHRTHILGAVPRP